MVSPVLLGRNEVEWLGMHVLCSKAGTLAAIQRLEPKVKATATCSIWKELLGVLLQQLHGYHLYPSGIHRLLYVAMKCCEVTSTATANSMKKGGVIRFPDHQTSAAFDLSSCCAQEGCLQAKMLKTSGGFHTSLMQPARETWLEQCNPFH